MSASHRFLYRAAALLSSAALAFGLSCASVIPAFAETVASCQLTDDLRGEYEADGTLDQRLARAEELGHDRPSEELIARARQREAGVSTQENSVPSNWAGGMPTEGEAHVIALYVDFPAGENEPAYTFEEGDTLDALDALIDGGSGAFPYEDLASYYYRSSYGALKITGDAYAYTAQHPRSYYEGYPYDADNGLFVEALRALDGAIDYTDYDGDKDGYIDAVYLHFAGPDSGWMSMWWSQEFKVERDDLSFDGVGLSNCVLLHNPSNEPAGHATIIHETGHALGLPDYYNATAQTQFGTWPTGIIGSDMMMDNVGDHNGFSKWLLGWLDEDQVTHVAASADGIDVMRGEETVGHIEPAEDGTSEVTLDLERFVTDAPEDTGGIIVVSNADEGIFSDYYVLQYDGFGGNQSLYVSEDGGDQNRLPNGFRMYRVRAELNSEGTDFKFTNIAGQVNSQLIELVDPDMEVEHLQGSGTVTCRASSGEYGCLLTAGTEVTSDTFPSTNFYESPALGYTGIGVRIDACEQTGGTVTISHTGKTMPDLPEFTVSLDEGEALYNTGSLHLTASYATLATYRTDPALLVDGERVPVVVRIDREHIEVDYRFDASLIGPDSVCELLLPAGTFAVGMTESGEEVTSEELRIPLPAGAVADVADAGTYSIERGAGTARLVSDVVELEDGRRAIFHVPLGGMEAVVTSPDGIEIARVPIEGLEEPALDARALTATSLSGDRAALVFTTYSGPYQVAVVDFATRSGRVIFSQDLYAKPEVVEADGDLLIFNSQMAALAELLPDGQVQLRYGCLHVSEMFAAGSEHLVWVAQDGNAGSGGVASSVHAAAARDIADALRQVGTEDSDGMFEGESVIAALDDDDVITFDTEGYSYLVDADARDGVFALLVPSWGVTAGESAARGGYVVTFDDRGTRTASYGVVSALDNEDGGASYEFSRLSIGADGAFAVSRTTGENDAYTEHEIVLFTSETESSADGVVQGAHLFVNGSMRGTWIENGSWLAIGWPMEAQLAVGSYSEGADAVGDAVEPDYLRYYVTAPVGVPDEPEPEPKPEPEAPDAPDAPDQPEAGQPVAPAADDVASEPDAGPALPSTGDAAALVAAALAMCGAFALVLGARCNRRV
ncbi:hypothetical protein H6A16_05040 [Collinsella tanakaei]|uniref:hypothetical protein n=1 Tax=Collinsella tanakaei TaxID=626935 RepID=UPI00195B8D73|nr:hypothetical protein [Collinsella tanakaei]MBM6778860.1 hypothetical protein [Collinsella tanakaei]